MNRTKLVLLSICLGIFSAGSIALGSGFKPNAHCDNTPAQYTQCTDYGLWLCSSGGGGCSGNCYTCAGPGGLPAKYCYATGEGCAYNPLNCGSKTDGNCQNNGTSCYCDGITPTGTSCSITNC